jgi:hypothetical protein
MKVHVYPADTSACGHFRVIWPAEELRRIGHDVSVVPARDRKLSVNMRADGSVHSVDMQNDVDVVVFQRITHSWLVEAVQIIRSNGIAVVIDIDDDLNSIHPDNIAWKNLHPRNLDTIGITTEGRPYMHSWQNLSAACRYATLVTVTSPGLLPVYASHGRGFIIPNYLPDHYYNIPRVDSDVIGWPALLPTHPNDPATVGVSIARLVSEGADFRTVANPIGVGRAFGLPEDPKGEEVTELLKWPAAIAEIGIGIVPLADTKFNNSKSFLKGLELSATGVPWVASPRAEYVRLHKLGCGVLAARPKDWYRELKLLRGDASRRAELSEAGRAVAETLRLNDHVGEWLTAWELALKLQRNYVNV